jgi:hypothetical protein
MTEGLLDRAAWIALFLNGLAILAFGVIVTVLPESPEPASRAIGVASIGMGLFGSVISAAAFRRRERWAWFSLWYYSVFWSVHFVGNLPPGQDHIHQIVFIALSLFGLIVPVREFLPATSR